MDEAHILGVHTIASYVGETPDMIEHRKTGLLYRFEEVEMLAQLIRKVFSDNEVTQILSLNGIKTAEKRHDRQTNITRTFKLYQKFV